MMSLGGVYSGRICADGPIIRCFGKNPVALRFLRNEHVSIWAVNVGLWKRYEEEATEGYLAGKEAAAARRRNFQEKWGYSK